MFACIGGIGIEDKTSRLIAADRAEETGKQSLANALRDTERQVVLRNGDPARFHELFEIGKPGTGNDLAKRVLQAIGSRKRKLAIQIDTDVSLSGRYWDGGSKSEYAPFNLSTMSRLMGFPSINPLTGDHLESQPTAKGIGIIETGHFCGKEATPCLHLHPDDAVRFGLEIIPGFPE